MAMGSSSARRAAFLLPALMLAAGCELLAPISPLPGGNDGGDGPEVQAGVCGDVVASVCAGGASQCQRQFCGGRLWRDGATALYTLIPYRILDPAGQFPDAYKTAIRAGAEAWSTATSGLATFRECASCTGRFVSVVPGDGDGVVDPAEMEEVLPLPVDAQSLANPPLHRIAHQWGHAIGLGHTYQRADRDQYVRFDPAIWCGAPGTGLPPRCAFGPNEPGSLAIASDTFGAYDEKSKMNGFAADGICGSTEPDPGSGQPTAGDAAAVEELFYSQTAFWAPFRPLGLPVSATEPLDYHLAPGVDPVGAPAIAAWTAPAFQIFARGSNGVVYQLVGQMAQVSPLWAPIASGADSDPASAFTDGSTLHLAVRAEADETIRLQTQRHGIWGTAVSLGAPANGAASAPALAARDAQRLDVLVLGGDGLVYVLTCTDPAAGCAASATGAGAWTALPAGPGGSMVSKPSAAWSPDGQSLYMTAVAKDGVGWLIGADGDGSFAGKTWSPVPLEVDHADPAEGIAIAFAPELGMFARNPQHALINGSPSFVYPPLGGVLASAPAVASPAVGGPWIDIAAVIEDHGHPGVWWKFWGPSYVPPCNYNLPGTCAQCGCNVPQGPSCVQ
jgi:hypothetical protein